MKQIVTVCAVLMLAVAAFAGQNPNIYAYVSFDPAGDEAQSAVTPTAYTTVSAYVCLGCIEGGVTVVSFGLNNALAEYPGVFATQQFTNLMPGGLAIGDPFVGGVTIASTECLVTDPVIVGYGSYFYLGGNGCIKIVDHGTYPRWVVDCQQPGVQDYYCLKGHGTVGAAVCTDGLETCDCDSPVEAETWGGIKALYK
jgi:hypothetical protein